VIDIRRRFFCRSMALFWEFGVSKDLELSDFCMELGYVLVAVAVYGGAAPTAPATALRAPVFN
jgi:hypothetical protein